MSRLPVALICGLPSAGKSTLADYVSEECANQHRVHCMLLNQERALDDVRCLAERGLADYLLLELSGTSDPEVAAAQLSPHSRAEAQLAELVRLDAIVTVVDATTVLTDFASWHRLIDRGLTQDEHDQRSLAEVIAEQIEFADIIVLNKTELASARAKHAASVLARSLNPDAVIIEAKWGRVPGRKVLFTYAFEFTQARERARWIRTLAGAPGYEADAHGISSFRYSARRPFHPRRLMDFVHGAWPGVVRCRGFFWLATRMDLMGELSQAGAARRFRSVGAWWATLSEDRGIGSTWMEEIAGVPWDASFGDRRQELAFVGIDMDEAYLRRRLDECLLDEFEFSRGREVWQSFEDPFPAWHASPISHGAAGVQ